VPSFMCRQMRITGSKNNHLMPEVDKMPGDVCAGIARTSTDGGKFAVQQQDLQAGNLRIN